MHEIIAATARLCRRHHGLELDRPAARLALLTVVDHLDRALDPRELAALADALPLALSLMLRRPPRADRMAIDLEERPLRAVCEALAQVVPAGPLAHKLREDTPEVLLGRRGPEASGDAEVPTDMRPTLPAPATTPTSEERPTLPVEAPDAARPASVVAAHGAPGPLAPGHPPRATRRTA